MLTLQDEILDWHVFEPSQAYQGKSVFGLHNGKCNTTADTGHVAVAGGGLLWRMSCW